jgi:hypothetical protein
MVPGLGGSLEVGGHSRRLTSPYSRLVLMVQGSGGSLEVGGCGLHFGSTSSWVPQTRFNGAGTRSKLRGGWAWSALDLSIMRLILAVPGPGGRLVVGWRSHYIYPCGQLTLGISLDLCLIMNTPDPSDAKRLALQTCLIDQSNTWIEFCTLIVSPNPS